jgi:hypothetical protein
MFTVYGQRVYVCAEMSYQARAQVEQSGMSHDVMNISMSMYVKCVWPHLIDVHIGQQRALLRGVAQVRQALVRQHLHRKATTRR